jgi:hypothetical protein
MRLKGISLPVNAVIVVALAVMVLLLIAAFATTGILPIMQTQEQTAWTKGCQTIQEVKHCDTKLSKSDLEAIPTGVDLNNDKVDENFWEVCQKRYGNVNASTCVCNCPACCN